MKDDGDDDDSTCRGNAKRQAPRTTLKVVSSDLTSRMLDNYDGGKMSLTSLGVLYATELLIL